MSYGIDRQLRDTQDSITSGTRKPLDNRLLDVLALQKIKEAQAQAKTELEASMPQSQGTVADQLTKSVIDAEKERMQGGIAEKAAQVGQVGQQQAQQHQQNMQRMAKGIPTQPAPNMARMAGGGIVAFAGPDGSLVDMPSEEQLSRVGLTKEQWVKMSPKERAAILPRRAYEQSPSIGQIGTWIAEQLTPDKKVNPRNIGSVSIPWRGDVDDPGAKKGEKGRVGGQTSGYFLLPHYDRQQEQIREYVREFPLPKKAAPPFRQTSDFGGLIPGPGATPSATPSTQPPVDPRTNVDLRGGLEGELSGIDSLLGSKQAPAGQAQTGPATAGVGSLITDAAKAKSARGEAVDWAGGVLGRKEFADQRADMLRRFQKANKAAEEKRAKDRFTALSARAGATGLGGALSAAAYNENLRDAALKDAALRAELGLEESNIRGAVKIAEAQVTAGTAASKAALEKAARDTLNDIRRQQKNATSASARQKLFVNVTKAIAELKQKNSADVEERISGDVSMLPIRRAAREGDPKAIAQVEAFKKKAREEAYTEVSNTLNELERLRAALSRQIGGWGSSVKPVSPPAKQQAEYS